ncbi:MAG: aspartate/glutamate racemase family protein [Candidatus Anammoxibacter sp.]
MKKKILGILGGMGPLASTEFLKTIYAHNLEGVSEQSYPDVILHSISSVPDRSESFSNNREEELFEKLFKNLEILNNTNVSKIVICCITSHYYISRIPPEISGKLISLINLIAMALIKKKKPSLLLATSGSYKKKMFLVGVCQSAKEYIIIPEDCDAIYIHNIIYERLKTGKNVVSVYQDIKELLKKYGTDTFIAGCTEFHTLVRYLQSNGINDLAFIDPLLIIAENLEAIMDDKYIS